MGFPVAKSNYNNMSGIGKFRMNSDETKMQVFLKDVPRWATEEEILAAQEKMFVINDIPDKCKFPLLQGKQLLITLSEDGSRIFQLSPIIGEFKGKLAGYVGDPPTIRYKDNAKYPYQYFMVDIKITAPEEYAGLVVRHWPRFNYRATDVNGVQVIGYFSRGDHTLALQRMDKAFGVSDDDLGLLKWSENPLPDLHRRGMHKANEFQFSMSQGKIDIFYPPLSSNPSESVEGFDDDWNADDGFTEDTLVDPGWDEETNSDKVSDEELPWDDDAPF